MYDKAIGVSILTNGCRAGHLVRCVESLLANCFYRPLIVGVLDNGSTDDTADRFKRLARADDYGIEWRFSRQETDQGCAVGTNAAHDLVRDCEYAVHLESDFSHLTEAESGVSKLWLRDAVEFMESGFCDYLYLRHMRNEKEMMMHWWSQWMPRVAGQVGQFLSCSGFWWSNNPTLRRVRALDEAKTLPLNIALDGQKGSENWSRPEMSAARPPKPWIHQWGMFVHERQDGEFVRKAGCEKYGPFGHSRCKYGFNDPDALFCALCDARKNFTDLQNHEQRYRQKFGG